MHEVDDVAVLGEALVQVLGQLDFVFDDQESHARTVVAGLTRARMVAFSGPVLDYEFVIWLFGRRDSGFSEFIPWSAAKPASGNEPHCHPTHQGTHHEDFDPHRRHRRFLRRRWHRLRAGGHLRTAAARQVRAETLTAIANGEVQRLNSEHNAFSVMISGDKPESAVRTAQIGR